ncbi:hypothetical protein [Rhizobium sp. PP-CC-3G-465]|uniref:hypothetical protein n=1 Tax=Rhizobium sp. PP-CC-3G-465 TaxID=2135648 RepID=UPI001045EF92|nr:hypothetical protein C8J33_1011985 [Rhizobium sp. PP-CC-3G-465]
MTESQDTVNVDENQREEAVCDNISRFNLPAAVQLKCSICDADFEKPAHSRREVCSFKCKEERGRRYARQYQADGRRMLAEMRRKFGGRAPTQDEIMAIIKRRSRT